MFGQQESSGAPERAIVGDVGSKSVRLALTDSIGAPDLGSLRTYDVTAQPTFSGILSQFGRDAGLSVLPNRCALAIAGAPRGEAMTLPNSRMLVSRSGLQSMLRSPPVIINECAASAWALTSARAGDFTAVAGRLPNPGTSAGVYCLFAVGTGLGVSVLQRDEAGRSVVLATEAGHAAFAPETEEDAEIVSILRKRLKRVSAEMVCSAPGLVRLHDAIAEREGSSVRATSPHQVTEGANRHEPVASRAVAAFSRMLWSYAGNMVLAHGAWDGMFVTGTLARVLRGTLRSPEFYNCFYVKNPYQRQLNDVPLTLVGIEHAELKGAAQALLSQAQSTRN